MADRTPLYDAHIAAGGKMVDFAGWMMPVNYGSQIEEHTAVRTDAGMFDVSHMTIVDIDGADAEAFLRKVIANNVSNLATYQALYSAALNAHGGILDDLIVYRLPKGFRVVVNASTREKMLDWFDAQSMTNMRIEHKPQVMLAVQGPEAINKLLAATDLAELGIKPFFATAHGDWLIGRTGYTGEDGVEVMLPADQGLALWQSLLDRGVRPAGLGARDTLRLEKGFCLHGNDIDADHTPVEAGLGWTVGWKTDFIGKEAIVEQKAAGPETRLVAFRMKGRGIPRNGYAIVHENGHPIGPVTSGTQRPSLGEAIGLGYVPSASAAKGSTLWIAIRDKQIEAEVVSLPFL